MGLFGGKSEEELRAVGTPTSARVTYVDDTGKRRSGGAETKIKVRVQIEEGAVRGRELDKTKWVPVAAMPRVGDRVSVRIDMDDPDDWAWGDIAMYQPLSASGGVTTAPVVGSSPAPVAGQVMPRGMNPMASMFSSPGAGFDLSQLPQMIQQAMAAGNVTFQQGAVIDTRGNPELREQILGQLRQFGVDVDAMEANGQIPPAAPAGQMQQPQMPAGDDVTTRLKRVDDLAAQGLLTDEEHREQRQRIIDSI
jgi:hypothetical protein